MKAKEQLAVVTTAKEKLELAQASFTAAQQARATAYTALNEVVQKEMKDNAVVKALMKVVALKDTCKEIRDFYEHWFLTGPDGDDWDYSEPYPEVKAPLTLYVKEIDAIANKAALQVSEIRDAYQDGHQDIIATADERVKLAKEYMVKCQEEYTRSLETLKFSCDDLPLSVVEIERLQAKLKELPSMYVEDLINAAVDEDNNVSLIITGSYPVTDTVTIDEDDFVENLSDCEQFSIDSRVDESIDTLYDCMGTWIPHCDVDIAYETSDVDYDGSTSYHKEYYESDTGYREPGGDFYYGECTASTEVSFTITIGLKKEVK